MPEPEDVRPECVGLMGEWFGHRMVMMTDFRAAAEIGMICSRCGLAVWRPTHFDGSPS